MARQDLAVETIFRPRGAAFKMKASPPASGR